MTLAHIRSGLALENIITPCDCNTTFLLSPMDNSMTSDNGIIPINNITTFRPNEGYFNNAVAIEEATTNLSVNPSFTTTSNWSLATNGAGNFTTDGRWGKITVSSSGAYYFLNQSITRTTPANTPVVFSVSFKNSTVGRIALRLVMFVGADAPQQPMVYIDLDGTGIPKRYSVIGTHTADSDKLRLDILTGSYYAGLSDISVEFTDAQLEQKAFATSFANGSRADGILEYNIPTNNNFTMTSYKKHALDTQFHQFGIVNNNNTFTTYYDGISTTSYENKWVGYAMNGVNSGNKTWSISNYNNPSDRFYNNDFIQKNLFYNYSLATHNNGYLFRTFVYASSAVTIWHRYTADNTGGLRVNNGTPQYLGGWMNPATNSNNPDVRIDLVKGWNVIEIWYMDYDTGGALILQRNSQGANTTGVADTDPSFVDSIPLSSVPQVLYMTAEMPTEFSSNKIYFNEKSNCLISELKVDSIAKTADEIQRWYIANAPFYYINNNAAVIY